MFESQVSATWPPFLDHHRIFGMTVMPSPAYIEMALAGAAEAFGAGHHAIADLTVHEALLLPAEELRTVQLILNSPRDGEAEFHVFGDRSLSQSNGEWTLHATGKVQLNAAVSPQASFSLGEVRSRCPDEIDGAAYYKRLRGLGLEFGASFRGITRLWRREGEALGQVDLPAPLVAEAGVYRIHPAFLDACFHLLGAPLPDDGSQSTYLLIGMDHFVLHAQPGTRVWNHTVLRDLSRQVFTGDIRLYDESGQLIAEALGLQLKRATRQALEHITRKQRHGSYPSRDWLYEVQWQPGENQRRPLDFAPRQIAEQVLPHVKSLSDQHSLPVYQDLLPELDKLAAAYVRQALHQLGWKPQPQRSMSAEALAAELGVVPQHHRLLGRLLQILDEDEIRVQEHDPQEHLSALMDRFGSTCEAEITLTGRCGQQLADVLRGQADPLQLLFPDGSFALTEKLYQDSPFARTYNGLAQQAIQSALARLPEGRKLRVLEIGAGTGGTTSYLLPILPAGRTEYVFTDVSPLFIARAQEKLHDHAFVRYQLLDIERDPAAQGFAPHPFDVIVAANVLHATADLRQTLKHVQQLLAPEGLLVLLEGTTRQRWVDITFGLLEGWYKFRDADLRPDYPLLSQERWLSLLASLGFTDAVALPDAPRADQALILARGPSASLARDWLIVSDSTGLGDQLADLIKARGETCHVIQAGESCERVLPQVHANIVYLHGFDATPAAQTTAESLVADQASICGGALQWIQSLLARGAPDAKLWLVTRNVNALANDQTVELAHSTLWGLGRVIALEHPELWGGLIDLDPNRSLDENAAAVLTEIWNPDGEDQIALRGGKRFVARLARFREPQSPVSYLPLRPDASYLITGGLGGLGLKLARWMAEQGARHIVLTGRSGLSGDTERKTAAIQAIEALGATVTVAAADVSDREQMVALLGRFGRDLPPLRGLVHTAADMSAWPVKTMTQDALAAMLRPKVAGTWILHELTREMPLDFLVLFSSTTALWGSRDLAHYAAANTFLDAFAHYRRSMGLPALSINWGIWDEMRTASAEAQAMYQQFGLQPMRSDLALEVMGDLLGMNLTQIAVAAVDWGALKPAYEAKRARPFLSHVGMATQTAKPSPIKPVPRTPSRGAEPARPELPRQIEAARPSDRRDVIASHVRGHVAHVLGFDPSRAMDDQQGLFEMGMDSLMSIELKSRLEKSVGHSLPSTLTFNYPTIAALTDYLLSQLAPMTVKAITTTTAEPPSAASDHDDLSEDELATLLAAKLSRFS